MPIMQSPPGAEVTVDGRRYVYFAGTAYLGLQGHPDVIRAACEATQQYGLGSATTRAWFGTMPPVAAVEHRAAEFFAVDDALYCASGYMAPAIVARALREQFDVAFVDQRAHYALQEGLLLAGRPIVTFRGSDPDALRRALAEHLPPGGRPLVASDGVFSVLGTIAPVEEYRQILAAYPGSTLLLDDAHAVGVLGANGRGTLEHVGLSAPLSPGGRGTGGEGAGDDGPQLVMSATLSKALGGFGGIIPGGAAWIGALKSHSPAFAGASAPPVPAAAASARALELVLATPKLRQQLHANTRQVKTGLRRLGLPVDDTPVPIICLALGDAANMQRIQQTLVDRGILIAYAAHYAGVGPAGALRMAVCALHTSPQIEQFLDTFQACL